MGIPRFIKLPTHKQFHYSPRYWDPDREDLEERIRVIKQEMGIEVPSDPNRTTIRRGSFRQASRKTRVRASRSTNVRLLVILAALFMLAYLLFYR